MTRPTIEPTRDDRITLYSDRFWTSPYVFSVFVALREKGLPFELETVSLEIGEQRLPGYRERSLTGRVPALEHGEFSLSESSAIVEYLEEVFAPPDYPGVLPRDVHQRARARQLMAFIRSDLMPLRQERPTSTMFYLPADRPLSEAGSAAALRLIQIAEQVIPDGQTSLFPEWSVADADFALMLQRLILNDYPVPPKVRAFADAQWSRPSVRAFVDHQRPPYIPY
jgi:glutathione S-transferase